MNSSSRGTCDSIKCGLRHRRVAVWLSAAALHVIVAPGGAAEAAKFMGLGDLPGGSVGSDAQAVSANGSVVVGGSISAAGWEAFRWTSSGGMVGLGDLPGGSFSSLAKGVSADGTTIAGYGVSTAGVEAFRWSSATGMVGLGDLPGGVFGSRAYGISADGSSIIGYGNSAQGNRAFRWTSATGMVDLGDLPGGSSFSDARAISADGSVVVGTSNSASGPEAFRWTSDGGMVGLGDLPGGDFVSFGFGVSADGGTIVGQSYVTGGSEAFRWTSATGMVSLGDLPGGSLYAFAAGTSADGMIVVGSGTTSLGPEAFIWAPLIGMQRVADVLLPQVGAALTGWNLQYVNGISADGRTLVGYGINPSGNEEGWLAYLADDIRWFPQTGGAWDSHSNWTGPFMPGPSDEVIIDPKGPAIITGPAAHRTINQLTLGGDSSARVSLHLTSPAGGDIWVTGGTTIHENGELVLGGGRSFSSPAWLHNFGIIRGSGTVSSLVNFDTGEVRVAAGESIVIGGGGNVGKMEVIGGSLEVIGAMTNHHFPPDATSPGGRTGLITARSAALRFQSALTNEGALALTGGINDISGDIINTGGTVTVTGGAQATFYDDMIQNGTLRVSRVGSTTSVAVFLGAFTGSGGATGGGDIFFEGDLRPGQSPGTVRFENNIGFGSGAVMEIEIGGSNSGQHDRVEVTGHLDAGGTLRATLIDDYVTMPGSEIEVVTFGSRSGDFALASDTGYAGLWFEKIWTSNSLRLRAAALGGDANLSGRVDIADLGILAANWQQAGKSWLGADFTGDGIVSIADLGILAANWQAGIGGGGMSFAEAMGLFDTFDGVIVPEPGALALAGLAGLTLLRRRRR